MALTLAPGAPAAGPALLSRPSAGRAIRDCLQFAAALAPGAAFTAIDLYGRGRAVNRIIERDRERVLYVSPAPRLFPGRCRLRADAAEDIGKDVFEIGGPETGEIEDGAGLFAREVIRIVSEPVVDLAFLGIGEHFERLRYLLEAILRFVVTRVYVGMVTPGEPPIRFLDIVRARSARNTKYLVIVTACHMGCVRLADDIGTRVEGSEAERIATRPLPSTPATCQRPVLAIVTSCRRHRRTRRRSRRRLRPPRRRPPRPRPRRHRNLRSATPAGT